MARLTSGLHSAGRLALLCLTSLGLVNSTTIDVHAGEIIQAAIDKAHSGDRVLVHKGNYNEQLTISTNGISLVGQGAILYPPSNPKQNLCSGLAGTGTEAGICVSGSGVVLADFVKEHRKVISVGKAVQDVSISGFEVHAFGGLNIAFVGAENAKVSGNTLVDGGQYGLLTLGSKGTEATGNTVTSTTFDFIAICMDDYLGVDVSHNHISNYYIGLCVQTNRAILKHNHVSDVCVGAFVDPGVKGAILHRNDVYNTNPICGTFGNKSFASGIVIGGAIDTDVRDNDIQGQTYGVAGKTAAGVLIYDDPSGAIASGNMIIGNKLKNNDKDILNYSTGTGNVISKNICATPDCS